MSRGSHIFTRLEVEIFFDPITAFVYFRGDILGAHADRLSARYLKWTGGLGLRIPPQGAIDIFYNLINIKGSSIYLGLQCNYA
jgi:hypothetical protein